MTKMKLVGCFFIFSGCLNAQNINCNLGDGWLGIKVLDNESRVVTILGKQTDDDGTANYDSEKAIVHVNYSAKPCTLANPTSQRRFPIRTVLGYTVIIRKPFDISTLGPQVNHYSRIPDEHMNGHFHYFSRGQGITFSTVQQDNSELVWKLVYGLPEEAKSLACP